MATSLWLCVHCKSRVLELFTCRSCGAAYARAYKDNVNELFGPTWSSEGLNLRLKDEDFEKLKKIDIYLEKPLDEQDEDIIKCEYDVETGRINPPNNKNTRIIFLTKKLNNADDLVFRKCASCKNLEIKAIKIWVNYPPQTLKII